MAAEGGKGPRLDRREALLLALTGAGSLAAGLAFRPYSAATAAPLRPPGALPEADFLASCIRCFQCGAVCPNRCLAFEGIGAGLARAYTPAILPRDKACILCMKCTQVCPTDALTPIPNEPEAILANVKMGVAKINEDLCFSFNGRMCGVCYYACPFPDKALRLMTFARPEIIEDACVGCGSCERACIHLPQAIITVPKQVQASER
jgi:MauM/NapG family ferredoxin protein